MPISALLIGFCIIGIILVACYFGITKSAEFQRIPAEYQQQQKRKLQKYFLRGLGIGGAIVAFKVFTHQI